MLDIFALVVILVIVALVIWLVITIASIPGNLAKQNNHPQVQAITTLSWLGVLTFGILWIVALVWAQIKDQSTTQKLELRISELEEALKVQESQK
jgi:cytochrome c biogenesis protein ResB